MAGSIFSRGISGGGMGGDNQGGMVLIPSFATVFGALSAIGVSVIIYFVFPPKPFLTIHEMRVVGGDVVASRTVHGPDRVADWRVTVVHDGSDKPSCQTIPGPELHEGWSRYSADQKKERVWPMDVWVGDPGCWERLADGPHDMFVTWTPRDNTPPVTARAQFTK